MIKKISTENFDFPLSEPAKLEIERHLQKEKLIYEIKEELYCNLRYKDFFDNYDDESIHTFIDEYARKKAFYLVYGHEIMEQKETNQLRFHHLAEEFIWEVQQKKLFDLQCQWRAEKIVLDGIQVTRDFLYHESTIKNCTLIDPITPDELQVYINYLFSEDYADKEHGIQWQDYDFMKGQSMMFSNAGVPAWYSYFDNQIHQYNMLSMADTRGDKELFYIDLLCKKDRSEQLYNDVTSRNNSEEKPSLQFNYKTLEFFVHTFEDKSVIKYFNAAEKKHSDINNQTELEEALNILKNSDEEISVHTICNWKDAVIEAAKFYKTQKIAEALLAVYEQNKMRIKTGLPFYNETDTMRQHFVLKNIENYKKQILKARELNGETPDFDF